MYISWKPLQKSHPLPSGFVASQSPTPYHVHVSPREPSPFPCTPLNGTLSLLRGCRYDYAVQGFTEVAVPGPRVLVFAKRVKGTCSNEPCRIDGPETPGAVAAVVVGLHVDSPPSMPGFGDNEGVLVSLLAAETHEDPKQHSRAAVAAAQQRGHGTRPASLDAMPDIVHSRRLFKIAEAFVSGAVGLGGLPTNVTLPVVLEAMPVGLRGAVAEGRARIWAEISSPGCCRYEYRSHPGVPALLDTTRQPPYALVKATLQQGEPCNATRACTL